MADWRLVLCAGLLLAGCSQEQAAQEPAVDEASLIECAIGTASAFTRNCSVERVVEDEVLFLTITHEDGGFRRLRVETDGTGVTAADGADVATLSVYNGEIEVNLGGDRYLLPATVTAHDGE